jgi:hypothetical protein
MSTSEIAQLRQHIDLEIAAMNRAKDFAAVAQHKAITRHMEALGAYLEQLKIEVGEEAAVMMLVEQMEQGV